MNCFVTGANGFLGSALCARLEARGDSVIQAARRLPGAPTRHRVQFDLSGPPLAANQLRDVACVFHLAGKAHALSETRQDETAYFNINTDGTRKLLESCRAAGVRRFVFFSSVKAMGEGGAEAQDESAGCSPDTPYGASKREAERLVLEGEYVPEPVVLRLSMVYGPTRRGNLPRMIEAVARGRFPPLPETDNRRSMVHVEDVVEAALRKQDGARFVPNDCSLTAGESDDKGETSRYIKLITGPNMSGKSTLLRSIGLNCTLAEAGGPVCAKSMQLPPLTVTTLDIRGQPCRRAS